jgi:hypothetical protein
MADAMLGRAMGFAFTRMRSGKTALNRFSADDSYQRHSA